MPLPKQKILTVAALGLVLVVLQTNADDNEDSTNDSMWSFDSVRFLRGFTASLTAILVSEIGDKTFFIAAIMSMVSDFKFLKAVKFSNIFCFSRNTPA